MRAFPLAGALFLCLLTACGSSSPSIVDSGFRPDAAVTDSGTPLPGGSCNPAAAASCPSALICDADSHQCRLPRYGEACDADAGCAAEPQGMTCTETTFAGSPLVACLIPCSSQNSSGCPYGTSCGDPNLPGYCSAEGSGSCTPGSSCTLGPSLTGTCVATGSHNTCLALGQIMDRYGSCNPDATNAQSSSLCGSGYICEAQSAGLGSYGDNGFCFPLCQAQSDCQPSEHCSEGSTFRLGVCRPGIACSIDLADCTAFTVCVPDSVNGLGGGCLPLTANPGHLGDSCQEPQVPTDPVSCLSGACLEDGDGGFACAALCDLVAGAGGKTFCNNGQRCESVPQAPATAEIGVCR